jgi:integrase
MACLYKRRKQFWISYYVDGKQVQKSLRTSSERIALAKKKRIEYEISLGDLHVASRLRLPVVLEAFCKHLEVTRTYKSFKNDFSRLRAFFGPICESLQPCPPGIKRGCKSAKRGKDKYAGMHVMAEFLEDISPEVINRFLADRIRMDSWAPKTANLMRQVLHGFFAFATKHHGFRSRDRRYNNPAACVERLREPAPQIRFLSINEITEQLGVLKGCAVIHTMVATYIYAGLRREEALWLTHDDFDLQARLIRIRAKTVEGEYWQPKTKRNRVVPISGDLYAILCDYEPRANCVWFFPSPTGRRWDPDNFSQDLRKVNVEHELDWSCQHFRHTFGSHLAQKGESLYKIAQLMGNSPGICRKHYAALIPEEMQDTVEFKKREVKEPKDDGELRVLIKRLLEKLGDGDGKDGPELRLVRGDSC